MTALAEISSLNTDGLNAHATFADSARVARIMSGEKPVFCFSPDALASQARLFLENFPGEVAYAVKSNPGEAIVRTLHDAGISVFDVASTVEMQTVAHVCGAVEFHYHNPVKSRSEIATAWHTFGCRRFAADSTEELEKIAQMVEHAAGTEIAIRFRLPSSNASVHDFSSKFGVDEACAADLMKQAEALGFTPILTFHPGSQCTEPRAWIAHIQAAARIARSADIELVRLNVGGGFPSRYAGSRGPALKSYFDTIRDAVQSAFGDEAPALECEPGRGMCAPSVSLLTRVKLVRGANGDVFLNDGIYGGLLEVAQAPDLLPFYRVLRDGEVVNTPQTSAFTIYGPTCDPLDVLPHRLDLPADIREDDVIEFAGIGAYGMATATRFNGYGEADFVSVASGYTG
jgi:ornithine decarboxylase